MALITPVVNSPISVASLPTTVPVTVPADASRKEAKPSSCRHGMKKVLMEIPDGGNLLEKSSRATV